MITVGPTPAKKARNQYKRIPWPPATTVMSCPEIEFSTLLSKYRSRIRQLARAVMGCERYIVHIQVDGFFRSRRKGCDRQPKKQTV